MLSQGQRQRLGLACALLHRPALLVLDEPANALDPVQVAALRTLIREQSAAGTAVILSTHLLAEVTAVCDRVAILHEGTLRHDGMVQADDHAALETKLLRHRDARHPSTGTRRMSLLAVTRLEWRRLLVRPLAWVLAALTLAWLAWNFTLLLGGFLAGQIQAAARPDGPGFTDLVGVPLLGQLAQLAFLVVPLLTMSVIAGDRRNGTLPLLFAAGVPASRIVLGKYLAVLAWLLLWLALTLAMPLVLAHATHLDWGKLAAATLGTGADAGRPGRAGRGLLGLRLASGDRRRGRTDPRAGACGA